MIPSELFKGSESEMREKVKMSIETCNVFLKAYAECRENFSQDSKIYPWEFPDQRVFQNFEKFVGRLNKVFVSLVLLLNYSQNIRHSYVIFFFKSSIYFYTYLYM